MRARNSFEPFTYYIECRKALASFTTSLALFKYFSEGNCLSLLLSRVDIFVAFRRFVRRSSNAVQNDDDVGSARQKRTENIFCSFCCCDERKRRKEKKKKTNFFGFKFESLLCSARSAFAFVRIAFGPTPSTTSTSTTSKKVVIVVSKFLHPPCRRYKHSFPCQYFSKESNFKKLNKQISQICVTTLIHFFLFLANGKQRRRRLIFCVCLTCESFKSLIATV